MHAILQCLHPCGARTNEAPLVDGREAEFLQLLDHPNIVECKDVVENEKQMVIIMEWLRGGHLLDNLEEMAGQHYSEQQAAILFVQVTTQSSCLLPHLSIEAGCRCFGHLSYCIQMCSALASPLTWGSGGACHVQIIIHVTSHGW